MAAKARRTATNTERRFLLDSKTIHGEIRRAKKAVQSARSEEQRSTALAKIGQAEIELKELSKARFEKLAAEYTTTGLRAMDGLIKLTNQPRYASILTRQHTEIIISQLQGRFQAVQSALVGTLDSQAAKQTVGIFVELAMFSQSAPAGQ